MDDSRPRITTEPLADGVQVRLLGRWTAESLAEQSHWQDLQSELAALPQDWRACTWELAQLDRMDHTGAQLLWNTWYRQWPDQVLALPAQRAMLQRVAQFSSQLPPRKQHTAWDLFLRMGSWVVTVEEHVVDALRLLGQLVLDCGRLVRSPRSAPWRDISGNLYRIGAAALPITALVGFLIGVVLAYLMSQQLRQFGADAFIVNVLGISLIRELGPMLAAILIAGRSGSAITAQIGVMRVTEELDAMKVMGIPQGYRLVLPRAVAMAVAMPLLAVWTTLAALLGGMLAADLVLGLTPAYFVNALARAVLVSNLWLAVAKSVVFGLLIALIGCHYGLRVKPNTQSLGEGTTASVVTSITVVIVVDAVFAIVFKDIGI
ncbi:MAG: MlaE family lipid ABC transporter permease subunit [Burkholderiales bacterium]|nr:MlaE family lipid ABC transporter permease subunit [Burkholderiales bacterium]